MAERKKKSVMPAPKETKRETPQMSELTPQERVQLIKEVLETLEPPELLTVRDLAERKRKAKAKEEGAEALKEMKGKLNALGLTLNDVIPVKKRSTRKKTPSLRVKYRSPNGETWSGTGRVPIWLRELEKQGHSRQEYAATAGVGSLIEKTTGESPSGTQ
jgi:DNA-binding protein H-NS